MKGSDLGCIFFNMDPGIKNIIRPITIGVVLNWVLIAIWPLSLGELTLCPQFSFELNRQMHPSEP